MLNKIPGFRSGSKWKKTVAIFGYGLIILAIIGALSGGPDKGQDADVISASQDQTTTEQPQAPNSKPEPTWQPVKEWSGNGMKSTETFRIASREWRINWETQNENIAGILGIYVYKADGSSQSNQMPVAIPVNTQGIGKDTAYVHEGPGEFYLQISSANVDWHIIVEDQR